MSLSIGILLYGEEIQIGSPWVAVGSGDLCVALQVDPSCRDDGSIQGTPEDMDRLAAAASEAAARARAAEAELRAKVAEGSEG